MCKLKKGDTIIYAQLSGANIGIWHEKVTSVGKIFAITTDSRKTKTRYYSKLINYHANLTVPRWSLNFDYVAIVDRPESKKLINKLENKVKQLVAISK